MIPAPVLTDRTLIAVTGAEARTFLQGLITNDIQKLAPDAALYAALLTPQGKILFDFLLYEHDSAILLDCATDAAAPLLQRLKLYRLRAKVDIAARDDLAVAWSVEGAPPGSWRDPRLAALGFRSIVQKAGVDAATSSVPAYTKHRLDLGVPEGRDLGENMTFALDADLEELHGVVFDKGCYVGQELTARMKHRGTARKRLLPVGTDAERLPAAGSGVAAGGRELGILTSVYHNRGFALLRLDRLEETAGMSPECEGISMRVDRPAWLFS